MRCGRIGKPPPGAWWVLQFGDYDRPVDGLQCGIIHAVRAHNLRGVHCLRALADDGPNVFRHAQVVSDGNAAQDLYCSGSLDAWYWRRRLHTRLSAFVEEKDFGVFRRIYLQIVGPRPCLAVGQLCLFTAGVYGWNDNVRIVGELDHLTEKAAHHRRKKIRAERCKLTSATEMPVSLLDNTWLLLEWRIGCSNHLLSTETWRWSVRVKAC